MREWNPAAEALFGYTAAEAVGRDVYELTATAAGLAVIDKFRAQALGDILHRLLNEETVTAK